MSHQSNANSATASGRQSVLVCVVFAAAVLGLVLGQSHVALLIWLLDGVLAAVALAACTVTGFGLLPLFRLGPLPLRWRLLASAGLGVGFLSVLVLVCGVRGWIGPGHRWIVPGVLLAAAVWGMRCLLKSRTPARVVPERSHAVWLLVVLVFPAALAVLVASLPPGILWAEEGFGYDVLEYHLQLPREYYENGVITYLPHNVYANFPSAAEMLYLFGMQLTGEPIESWSVAKCFNALLAVLVVAGMWLAGRELSPRAGIASAVAAGSTGWLVYLSGIAYVENGLLAMGALSLASAIRAGVVDPSRERLRWVLLAGVFAGLACGFKYTGVVLIALPVGVLLLVHLRTPVAARASLAAAFCLSALVAFSPWLIKNTATTGNPVFPLCGAFFESYPQGWGAEESTHFAEAHAPAPEERSVGARLALLWKHVPGDKYQRFGAVLFAMALLGLLRGKSRTELAIAIMLFVQIAVWLAATHLYARFAVPMLIPLALLAGRGVVDSAGKFSRSLVALLCLGAVLNSVNSARLYAAHIYRNGERLDAEGATAAFTDGWVDGFAHLGAINKDLPPEAHVLLVGDARPFYIQRESSYCVVFNQNPFAEILDESPRIEDVVEWLRERGYTHVFVHWGEVSRLRNSRYGFPESICTLSFEELEDAGMRRTHVFSAGDPAYAYGALYDVPQGDRSSDGDS